MTEVSGNHITISDPGYLRQLTIRDGCPSPPPYDENNGVNLLHIYSFILLLSYTKGIELYTWIYIKYYCYSNNIIRNINKVTKQIDNNSTVNDMLFRELILLFRHA